MGRMSFRKDVWSGLALRARCLGVTSVRTVGAIQQDHVVRIVDGSKVLEFIDTPNDLWAIAKCRDSRVTVRGIFVPWVCFSCPPDVLAQCAAYRITYDAIFNRLLEIILANITVANICALVGATFFVATLLTRTMVPLRVSNMISNVFLWLSARSPAISKRFSYLCYCLWTLY
jgi:hypothetical protein